MKTLTNLSGQVFDDPDLLSPREVRSAHVVEIAPAFWLRMTVGELGLVIGRPPHGLRIPTAELVRLAREHVPELNPGTTRGPRVRDGGPPDAPPTPGTTRGPRVPDGGPPDGPLPSPA